MIIRKGDIKYLKDYLEIYSSAMDFMIESGNKNQWTKDHHPDKEAILKQIEQNSFYDIYDKDFNKIVACFALIYGKDPTYNEILGSWLNDSPYVTLHMIAKRKEVKGIFHTISNFAKAKSQNVRIDTHEDNKVMQNAILKRGFKYCGIIHLNDKNHSERLAYQFVDKDIEYDKYKLFIVDYDGTIINSMAMWRHTCSGFLKSKGISFTEDIDKKVATMTNSAAAAYVQANYLRNLTISHVMHELTSYVIKSYPLQRLKPNSIELLKKLKALGRVVIYSATSMPLLLSSMEALGIRDYFDEIYSGSELSWTKTDGTGFLYLIEREGYKKEEVLIIEDSIHAIIGAKKQNLAVLGVEDTENQEKLFLNYELSDYFLPLN